MPCPNSAIIEKNESAGEISTDNDVAVVSVAIFAVVVSSFTSLEASAAAAVFVATNNEVDEMTSLEIKNSREDNS